MFDRDDPKTMIPPIDCGAKDKDTIQLEISKSLTHGRAPTYIQNPDQLQLLAEPNEDNHKGKLNKNNLIAVTNVTLPFIMPYEDEVDEFNRMTDKMIKEDIEQESLPGSWLRVAVSATTRTREESISKMSNQCPRLDLEDGRIELCVSQPNQGFFCKLTEKYPGEICDWLNLIYESLKDQSVDREKAASKLENDNGNDVIEWDKRLINKKLRVEEAMVLIIQRAGKSIKWGKELNGSKYISDMRMIRKLFEMAMVIEPIPTILKASSNEDVKKPNMKSEIGIQGWGWSIKVIDNKSNELDAAEEENEKII
ncbi:hypothetical protein PPACK8108_LOCUS26306 [Phakopsora pachyrhizi]|uniref:Uncharacterized protein n=1 Tax=Phakopsora pachyrhizi TaxID=170000 RepID=A0AAV0BVY3_PHAPC|nr:hypothetical protein PPACK8108_LOCUS26306 [Phakopsora pachyrhizi]